MILIRKYGPVVFLLFFVLMLRGYSYAQPFRAEAGLDTNTILIGDQIYLTFNITQPKEAKVAFPAIEENVPQKIEVIRTFEKDTIALENDNIGVRQRFLVTSFDTGSIEIPPFKFIYSQNGRSDSLQTLPLDMTVQAVKVDTTQSIFDIKAPFAAPISFMEALPYIAGILGLGLLVLAIVYIINKIRKREPLIKSRKPTEPAHVYALRELDKLRGEKLWQQDRVKLYYTRLTEILRTYLWMRYGIKTLERTTDEILYSLKKSDFSDNSLFRKLEDTLRLADLVKFAKMVPSPSENDECLDIGYEFVNKTKYIPEESEGENSDETEEASTANIKKEGPEK